MEIIEYYYALASPWSFIGHKTLINISNSNNLKIDPIIIDYEEMFKIMGTVPLPKRPAIRKSYRLIDIQRWADFRKVPLNIEPKYYKGEIEEPNEREAALMVTAAKTEGLNSLRLAYAISRALWVEDRFPFSTNELISIADSEGFDGEFLWTQAQNKNTKINYKKNTTHSVERGVFGMPFYIFRNQPYWGQDKLEILEYKITQKN